MLAGALLLANLGWSQAATDVESIRTRAAQGDLEAQNALGNACTNGLLGLKPDFAEAMKWYRQAGDKGFAPAQFNLGLAYELGRGVAVDERQAFKFYLMAAEQGYAPAQFNAGNMYSAGRGIGQDYFEANLWYKQAADSGLVEAQYNLGFAYETGRGVKKDEGQAARWYKQAADHGYARAQYNLGILLEDGRGLTKDPAAAAALYRSAAEQGFAPAQVNYGLILSEGKPGVARDPVQAFVWLNRAVQNGANPEARDALAKTLTAEQVSAANRLLGGGMAVNQAPAQSAATAPDNASAKLIEQLRGQSQRLAGQVEALNTEKEAADRQTVILTAHVKDLQQELQQVKAAGSMPVAPAADVSRYQGEIAALTSKLEQATGSLKKLEQSHAQLTEVNQRLQQENASLAAAAARPGSPAADGGKYPVQEGDKSGIIANLQRDNARLNDEVKRSTRELLSLNQQLRSLRSQPAQPAAPGPNEAGSEQVAQLTAKAQHAAEQSERLEADNRRLTARLAELEKSPKPVIDESLAPRLAQAQQATEQLQRQLKTLQEEKTELEKRSGLLEKTFNEKSTATALLESTVAELRQKTARVDVQLGERDQALTRQSEVAARLADENKELNARLTKAEDGLKAATGSKASPAEVEDLRQQLVRVQTQAEKLDAEKQVLTIKLAAEQQGESQAQQRLAELEKELRLARSADSRKDEELAKLQNDLTAAGQKTGRLNSTLEELTRANDQLKKQLGAGREKEGDLAALRDELTQAQSRIAGLQRDLSLTQQQVASGASGNADLKRQLELASQAVEKSKATAAELTAANEQLEKNLAAANRGSVDSSTLRDELTAARRDLAELAALRDENTRLHQEAVEAASRRTKGEQLIHDSAQLTASLNSSRHDLEQSQARVTELEKQLADALTVRTRGGDDSRKTQVALDEANRSVEKLNATVAELTAANEKLEKDLDSAQKSTAAALAAQSQAVSAASPDAYQMEISTLNARIKQLDAQVEEERANAAREVSTLAAQMQRVRETNKSLTDANRALLSAKDNDTAATRDDLEQLQGRVRELTAANEEFRRAGQKQAADLRSLTAERDGLQSQLVDARKVATTLPGLADDKAALQERLEAVGNQLVQLQREHEELQKSSADLTQQLAASRQATEKAQSDLAAVQGKAAEAEKAAESHTTSVAELTQANAKLEQQQEDMRRLVESYRADITRLTQTARAAEQQKAEAERSGQQNIDAVTAQLGQLRREVEAGRTAQARLAENFAVQDRDRAAVITQLRTENSALAARLNQAQGTLDQIASAARLGTPAATIASGGLAPVRPAATAATSGPEVRYHLVAEGDSLSRISMRYYGTPNRWQEIFQANRDILQGSSALRVGMQLRIP